MGGPVCRSDRKTVRDRSGEETILTQREPVSQGGNIHPGKIVTAIESKNTNLYSGILYIKPRNTRAVKESKIADLAKGRSNIQFGKLFTVNEQMSVFA